MHATVTNEIDTSQLYKKSELISFSFNVIPLRNYQGETLGRYKIPAFLYQHVQTVFDEI
jgi:hypothetical protein